MTDIERAERFLSNPKNRLRMARLCHNWKWAQSESAKMGLTVSELVERA